MVVLNFFAVLQGPDQEFDRVVLLFGGGAQRE